MMGARPPTFFQNSLPTWLPHWPTCKLMISRGMLLPVCARLRLVGPAHRRIAAPWIAC
jgi:hypothetical protein